MHVLNASGAEWPTAAAALFHPVIWSGVSPCQSGLPWMGAYPWGVVGVGPPATGRVGLYIGPAPKEGWEGVAGSCREPF